MSVFPATVAAHTPAHEALATAALIGVHHVVVVDGEKLLGMVCRCDLRAAGPHDPVARCTRHPALSIEATDSLAQVARTLLVCGVGCVAVIDEAGKLRGTITRRDLRQAGVLSDARGADRCARCGTRDRLDASCPDKPALCRKCRGRGSASRRVHTSRERRAG